MLKEVVIDGWFKGALEGPLDEVIENLQKIKDEYSKRNFANLRINIDVYSNGEYDIELLGSREEMEHEKTARLFEELETLRRQKEADIRLLEILKKKYES